MSEEYSELVTSRYKALKRRSSIQKIIHICNQSYQVFPYVFLWVQDFQSSIQTDVKKLIPFFKSFLVLQTGVYLSLALLSAELLYCLSVTLSFTVSFGAMFFLGCIGILSAMAFQIFNGDLAVRKKLRGSFFVKKKVY